METLPYMVFTIHIPMEWLAFNVNYEDLLNHLINVIEEYFTTQPTYNGLVVNIIGIEAALFINIMMRILWFRRIRVEDDPRPSTVHYYPPLAPPSLEDEWHWGVNNDNVDNVDNVHNEIFMENCISSTTQDIKYNSNDDDK
ncbi:hypothetical protein PV328_011826 [Microctonus aethiopoides]|uniref:Uncharacterized protein n=1 Tax=Microctonus aethiopoides TaxID=144406 RepID=A0AA39FHG5_9HYME|nr:hypothetical protein PV328_011826 [Microctonus aethiopoides]